MIQYISYADLNEFYSIKEVCRLLEMDKEDLRKSCEKFGVKPSRNETGDWGMTCHDLRRLHNFLYKETNYYEANYDDFFDSPDGSGTLSLRYWNDIQRSG